MWLPGFRQARAVVPLVAAEVEHSSVAVQLLSAQIVMAPRPAFY